MIEESLLNHLRGQEELAAFLTTYAGKAAVFSQEAPHDEDDLWDAGPQYGRIVFTVDLQGDPERCVSGTLVVDILCQKGENTTGYPEDIEPILRPLIHGWFFSSGTFTVAAQWRESNGFTQSDDNVIGCTMVFGLLAFPVLTTSGLDVISRLNEWTSKIDGIYVINYTELPAPAWKPEKGKTAVYWRRQQEGPSRKIRDRYSTIWRTAIIKGHIFSKDIASASAVADDLIVRLYTDKRLLKPGESPIMVDDRNTHNIGADPLRDGQVTVEATYGIIRYKENPGVLKTINYPRISTKGDPVMASNPETKAAVTKAAIPESVYSAAELADNCKIFGTRREVVAVALRLAGKESATLAEAKAIVDKFKKKEVK